MAESENIFRREVKAAQYERAVKNAQAAEEERRESERQELVRAEALQLENRQQELNVGHVGIDPEVFFDENDRQLCVDFLEFMAENSFPGSTLLKRRKDSGSKSWFSFTLRKSPKIEWSIQGYHIGRVPEDEPDSSYRTSSRFDLGHPSLAYRPDINSGVYLCTDSKLRFLREGNLEALPLANMTTLKEIQVGSWADYFEPEEFDSDARGPAFTVKYARKFKGQPLKSRLTELATEVMGQKN